MIAWALHNGTSGGGWTSSETMREIQREIQNTLSSSYEWSMELTHEVLNYRTEDDDYEDYAGWKVMLHELTRAP